MRIFKTRKSFKKEFRRQLKLALIAAIGFTVAFAWRNAIWNSAHEFIEIITEQTDVILNELITAIFITILAVIAIFLVSKFLRDK